jgi:serine/threonine-protein kinase
MFTGRRMLDGVAPSTIVPDLDPAIERVILRCLERDPSRRPASALAVAAALPGPDLLAAAIARGETPSPDMVAAGGEAGSLTPAIGAACLGAVVAGLFVLAPFTHDFNLIGLTTIEMSPQALTERAHAVLRDLAYTQSPADEAVGYASDADYLQYIDEHDRSPNRWRALAAPQPPALLFWYRQAPHPFVPVGGADIVSRQNPPPTRSGMISLTLDQKGRLVSLLAIPVQAEGRPDSHGSGAVDWTTLFADAGLPQAQFSSIAPQWTPPVFADTRAAWAGAYPDRPDVPIRVEAASAFGKPVSFEIVAPWTRPSNDEPEARTTSSDRVGLAMRFVIQPLVFAVALLLAYRNLRLGRGDRRGAMRLSVFLFAAGGLSRVLAAGDLKVVSRGPAIVLFLPAAVWLLYIALEPQMRRIWPEMMISWSRLLAGNGRDPLVGRDVLAGVMLAVGNSLMLALHMRAQQWSGRPPGFPAGAAGDPFFGIAATSDLLLGGRFAFSRIIASLVSFPVLLGTMLTFFLLFVLFALLRRRWLSVVAMIAVLTMVYIRVHAGWLLIVVSVADTLSPSPVDVAIFVVVQAAIVLMAIRFGLLTMVIGSFVTVLLMLVPLTLDSAALYASSSFLTAATVVGLAAYGAYTAIGGKTAIFA